MSFKDVPIITVSSDKVSPNGLLIQMPDTWARLNQTTYLPTYLVLPGLKAVGKHACSGLFKQIILFFNIA